MARVAVTISLSDDERAELEALSRRRKTSQGLARRARIVKGLRTPVRLEASADTVGKWRRRYAAEPRRSVPIKSAMTPSRKWSG